MTNIQISFLITGLAGLSTIVGCFFLFLPKTKSFLVSALGFASGIMICVSLTDLIPSSFSLFTNTYKAFPALLFCCICFCLGVIISALIDKYLPEQQLVEKDHTTLYRIGLISMIAIILHNIPEGIATFMTASTNLSLGISFAVAIALHNIPEGISIAIPIYHATGSKKRAFFYCFISGLSEPLGALLAYFFLAPFVNDFLMASIYAIIAGLMIQISLYELLPTALKHNQKTLLIGSFITGFFIMLITHIIL